MEKISSDIEIGYTDLKIINKQQATSSLVAPSNATYDWYVNASKNIIKNLVCQQAVIGFYATKVCTIRHGGISNGYYTITDFAKDIGLNRKTLSEWVAIYRRVIQHLDIDPLKMTNKQWSSARRIAYKIDGETRQSNIKAKTPKGKSLTNLPKREEIKKLFNEDYENGPSVKYEVSEWNGRLRTIYSKLQLRDLSLSSEDELLEIMNVCDNISDLINDFLTSKKRNKK
jgi:hypothetical protein